MTDNQNDYQRFSDHWRLTDELMQSLPKEQLAEAARILAMNVAHYQANCGVLPMPSAQLLNAQALNDDSTKLLADGLQTLAGVLALVMGLESDDARGVH